MIDEVFLPGDLIIDNETRGIGIVVNTTINGMSKNECLPSIHNCFEPSFYEILISNPDKSKDVKYSCRELPLNDLSKNAWFTQSELSLFRRGEYSRYMTELVMAGKFNLKELEG